MKKIKEIKIVNQDESTELANIGADAINVDYNNTTVKNELDKLNSNNNSLINKQTDLQNQINRLASGSPLVASSISEMIDTTRIYVNTTDGHWYYYDGTTWQDGGVYQSVRLGDNVVQYENLSTQLQADTISVSTVTDDVANNDKFIRNDLQLINGNNFFAFVIDVEPNDYIQLNLAENLTKYGATNLVYAYAYNTSPVRLFTKTDVSTENNRLITNITIPENVNKLYINTTAFGNAITKISKYKPNNIGMNQFDSLVKSLYEEKYTNVKLTPYLNGAYFLSNGQPVKLSGYTCYILPVNKGDKFKITAKQIYDNFVVGFSSTNGVISKVIDGITYTTNCIVDKILSSTSGAQFTDEEFIVPDYCSAIYINKDNKDNTFKLEKLTSYQVKATNIDADSLNPLNNKSLGFVGDSICAASTQGVKGWPTLLTERNNTLTCYNYGVDGHRIGLGTGDNGVSRSIQADLLTLLSNHTDIDLLLIEGGVNDYWSNNDSVGGNISLGSISNDYSTFNKSTFLGGLEYIIYYMKTNYPNIKLCYIGTHHIKHTDKLKDNLNYDGWLDKAYEVCEKWGIPYINLKSYGLINGNVEYDRTHYFVSSDGCHPNLTGYELETDVLEKELKYRITN